MISTGRLCPQTQGHGQPLKALVLHAADGHTQGMGLQGRKSRETDVCGARRRQGNDHTALCPATEAVVLGTHSR